MPATGATITLDVLNVLLGLSGLTLLTLVLVYRTSGPADRLRMRLDREVDLGARHARKGRLAHAETHARRVHILTDLLRANRRHIDGDDETLGYVLAQ